ncbi:Mating-type protein ALPHA2 [Ogataea parapolymorpha DL-1]|uniref:Mating-type protein ALPHA2 n=1 Tax=Ogataea parapolymorpha (strain ATCC 26012 / BCRC 20466 / JCM 22074 / NRRL Y-7560 / DL-1) TaxID=871575 RepID=W1QES5_OGAPD|nr:Mating-type protein ALPHA2 [Ogataea parapolymorpha DL-1]ESW98388.1 Mating-type protein ALPHA2 [Ogataea parapolymorpha DL-1]
MSSYEEQCSAPDLLLLLDRLIDSITESDLSLEDELYWDSHVHSLMAVITHTVSSPSGTPMDDMLGQIQERTKCLIYILMERQIRAARLEQLLLDYISCKPHDKFCKSSMESFTTERTIEYTRDCPPYAAVTTSQPGYKTEKRSKRFPKTAQMELENWYTENEDNPYLSKRDLQQLVHKTGLCAPQVRNWVSNRRRKERTLTISKELSDLLNQDTDCSPNDVV